MYSPLLDADCWRWLPVTALRWFLTQYIYPRWIVHCLLSSALTVYLLELGILSRWSCDFSKITRAWKTNHFQLVTVRAFLELVSLYTHQLVEAEPGYDTMCSVVLLLLYSNHLVGYMGVSIPGRTLSAWLILLTCRLVDSCSLVELGFCRWLAWLI